MSQTALAKAARVSQPTIASVEAGTQRTARALPRIARALMVEVHELDPDFPADMSIRRLDIGAAATAFAVVLETIRPDLSDDDRQALARVFLSLALEGLDEKIPLSLADQMRLRAQLLVRGFRPK